MAVNQENNNKLLLMSNRDIKITILIALFILTTIFCFLPQIVIYFSTKKENNAIQLDREEFKKRRRRRRFRKNALSLMNCFASGVFLGVCLLDLLPEVEENIEEFLNASKINNKFPLSQFFVVIGFLILLILEQLVALCKKNSPNPFSHHHHHHHQHNANNAESLVSSTASTIPPSLHDLNHHHHHDEHSLNISVNNYAPSNFANPMRDNEEDYNERYDNIDINSLHQHNNNNINDDLLIIENRLPLFEGCPQETSPLLPKPEDEDLENLAELEEAEIEQKEIPTDPRAHSNIRYVMLAIALSVHSIFEGLALGLEPKIASVFQLFIAIAVHKCVVAFSFGLNMSQSSLKLCTKFSSLIVFCLASPVGAVLGLAIELVSYDKGAAGGVIGPLQGLACGSFIYVVFFELLPHEFFTYRKKPSPLLKALALTVGVALMTCVMMLEPGD